MTLDPRARQDIYLDLASHFESLPKIDGDKVKSVDDLTSPIELYHTLLELGRAKEAFDILMEYLFVSGASLQAFRELGELAELFTTRHELMQALNEKDNQSVPQLMAVLGICWSICGDCARALDSFKSFDAAVSGIRIEDSEIVLFLAIKSIVFCRSGRLADAEWSARKALHFWEDNKDDLDAFIWGAVALAYTLIRRGDYEEGLAWLADYRLDFIPSSFLNQLQNSECAMAALRKGDISLAQTFADKMIVDGQGSSVPSVRSHAMAVRAAVAEELEEYDLAHELLSDSLVCAREARMIDTEAGLLIEFGKWSIQRDRLNAAREYVSDALHIIEYAQLRLRQVDATNLLSRIEYACGNRQEAARAAVEAYRLAWCDGPPFTYEWGIRQARENLAAVGEPVPADLPQFNSSKQMPEVSARPTSRPAS